jgi:hypothetical protein
MRAASGASSASPLFLSAPYQIHEQRGHICLKVRGSYARHPTFQLQLCADLL